MEFLKILNEFIVQLTEMQKLVLLMTKTSATPLLAKEFVSGKLNLIEAKDFLEKYGLIVSDDNGISITPQGERELEEYNLYQNDQITEDGQQLIDASSDLVSYY